MYALFISKRPNCNRAAKTMMMMMNIYQCERRLTDCQCILHVCKEIRFHFYTQSLIWRWHTKVIHISSKLFTLSMLEWNSSRVHMFAFTIWMELKKKEKRKHLQTSRACVSVPRIAREWLVPFWCIYVNWAIQNNETKNTSIVCIFGGALTAAAATTFTVAAVA